MKKTSENLVIDEETAKAYIDKVTSFLNKNKLSLILILILIISLTVGTFTYSAIKRNRDEKASASLSELINLIKNDANSGSSFKEIETKISDIRKNFSAANSISAADLIYSSYLYDIGKYADAADNFEEASKDLINDELLGRIAKAGSGYSYLMNKDNKKAISAFESISSSESFVAKDEAYFNIGLAYKGLAEQEKTIESFKNILKVNENSIYTQIVKEKFPG